MEAVPAGRWQTCTLVQAIALDGTCAAMVFDDPMNSVCFTGFCETLLAPTLNPGELLVMNKLGSHRSERARLTIEAAATHPVLLPPCSPAPNPIEMIFSKLKQLIRSRRSGTLLKVVDATGEALNAITTHDIQACDEHCEYLFA